MLCYCVKSSLSRLQRHSSSPGLSLFPFLVTTLPGSSEVTTIGLWRYTNTFIIILISINIFWPRYSVPREWKKLRYAIQKSTHTDQAGMNLTPPPPSQNSHAVRWHCTAESERRVAEVKADFCLVARVISKLAPEFIIIIFYTPCSIDPRG